MNRLLGYSGITVALKRHMRIWHFYLFRNSSKYICMCIYIHIYTYIHISICSELTEFILVPLLGN